MARRLKMIIAYDGKGFAGWQSQSHRNTIQDHIERTFERVAGKPVRVHGAGRTDAGVHALAQCAHVDLTDTRFSAKGKLYRYRIWPAPVLSPFEYGRAWHVTGPLDLEVLKAAAKHFIGTHDFAGFAANRGKREKSTIRTIYSVRVRRNGPCVMLDFDGDGFLYKMVRLIVGSLVKCALGKLRIADLTDRLASTQPGMPRFAAPAEGLFLVRVR